MTAPTVNGPVTIARVSQRAERIKAALGKDKIKPEKKAALESELQSLVKKASDMKAELNI